MSSGHLLPPCPAVNPFLCDSWTVELPDCLSLAQPGYNYETSTGQGVPCSVFVNGDQAGGVPCSVFVSGRLIDTFNIK